MTAPFFDHTQLPPEQWQAILRQALADLRANPNDQEALEAIKDANMALNAYEQPAIQAGENVGVSGFGKVGPALAGLGEAALDVPRGVAQAVLHPIETVKSLPKLPGAIAAGLTSGDPEQIARTIGNVGSLALPFARTSRAAGAPTVAGVMSEVLTRPFRAAGDILRRPGLRNVVLEKQAARAEQLAKQQAERAPAMMENLELRNQILQERLNAMQESGASAASEMPSGSISLRPGEAALPMEGTQGRGFEVVGARETPPPPVTPTISEIQERLAGGRQRFAELTPERILGVEEPSLAPEAIKADVAKLAQELASTRPGQKAVIFGKESPLSKARQVDVKTLLGEIARLFTQGPQ